MDISRLVVIIVDGVPRVVDLLADPPTIADGYGLSPYGTSPYGA